MTEPDLYSALWYRTQFKGQQWAINKACAEYVSAADLIEALNTRVTALEAAMEGACAELGRLRESLDENMEKMRVAYRELKQGAE